MGIFTLPLAFIPRLLLTAHGFVAVWRAVIAKDNEAYFLLLIGVGLMLCELIYVMIKRHGQEWEW